jgi:regulator of sigma E protease
MGVLQNILHNFWWLLVLIGVMIVIHELGHYLAARFFDVHIEAFSVGFGPKLFKWQVGETEFRISWLPFGGYVKMAGEQPADTADPRGFNMKPRWQRLIIVAAGPIMNVVLAVSLMTGLFMYHYPKLASASKAATIGYVKPDSPAAKAGLLEGDIIVQLEDKQDPTWDDVMLREVVSAKRLLPLLIERNGKILRVEVTPEAEANSGLGSVGWAPQTEIEVGGLLPGMDAERKGLKKGDQLVSIDGESIRMASKVHDMLARSEGKPVHLVYRRDNVLQDIELTPTKNSDAGGQPVWMIGVALAPRVVYVQLPFIGALQESVNQNVRGATLIYQFLRAIAERRSSAKSLEGPIGIAQLSGEAAREGPFAFISLMATVSLNLAIFNLLPIPILDGGMLLLLLIEMVIRHDLSLHIKETVFKLGFVFLMMVVAFVIYNDISKILPGS